MKKAPEGAILTDDSPKGVPQLAHRHAPWNLTVSLFLFGTAMVE
jgi:hypothetical protein